MRGNGFVRSRMRESRTYGSVRGGYRKVPVYSIGEEKKKAMKKVGSLVLLCIIVFCCGCSADRPNGTASER